MGNSPRYQGFLDPPYNVTLTDDSGAALDLTGCTTNSFTLTMLNENTGLAQQGTGAWTVANQTTNKGQASYQWTTNDMATVGPWLVYTTVKLPSEPSPREFDPELIQILAGTVGAGIAPAGILPVASATTKFYVNLADYCKIDGTSDDSVGFTAAYTLAASKGMALWHPGGTLLKGNDTIQVGVHIYGAGRGVSIIKLKNGANVDLFSANTANINLSASFGTGAGPVTGCVYNFGLHNLTLDGNRANQTGGPSYCLRFYGYGFTLENCLIEHGYTGGALWDYYGPFPDQNTVLTYSGDLEEHVIGTKFMYNNGIGVQRGGPSDGQWSDVVSAENGSHSFHVAPNGTGLQLENCHFWFPGQGNRSVGVLCEASVSFNGCEAEGSDTIQLLVLHNNVIWKGAGVLFGGGHNGTGYQLGQAAGGTPYNGQVNQSGGLTTIVKPTGCEIDTQITAINNANGAINVNFDGGANVLRGSIIVPGNTQPTQVGSFDPSDMVNILAWDQTHGGQPYWLNQNTGPIVQQALLPDGTDISNGVATTLSTSLVYYVAATLPAAATLVDFRVYFGAGGAGLVNLGIYSDNNGVPGTRLYTSSNNTTATGTNTDYIDSHATPLLAAGRYWLALQISNAADTVYSKTGIDALMTIAYTQTNSGLPATAGSLTHSAVKPIIIGILQNSWA